MLGEQRRGWGYGEACRRFAPRRRKLEVPSLPRASGPRPDAVQHGGTRHRVSPTLVNVGLCITCTTQGGVSRSRDPARPRAFGTPMPPLCGPSPKRMARDIMPGIVGSRNGRRIVGCRREARYQHQSGGRPPTLQRKIAARRGRRWNGLGFDASASPYCPGGPDTYRAASPLGILRSLEMQSNAAPWGGRNRGPESLFRKVKGAFGES